MKILLINPPTMESFYGHLRKRMTVAPPINLAYLAAPLEQASYTVEILDANALEMSQREIEEKLDKLRPNVVGITVNTPLFVPSLHILRMVKQLLPEALTVVGGAHPTALPEETARHEECDVVVGGEGDLTLLELVEALAAGKDWREVTGIWYRQDGQVLHSPPRDLIPDLDTLPIPAYHLLPIERYRPSPQHMSISDKRYGAPLMAVLTSRGCPYACHFCAVRAVFGRRIRFRSVNSILAEIETLVGQFGVRRINFLDDTFTTDKRRVHEICDRIIAERLDFRWTSTTRVDRVDEELLRKMRAAGCEIIFYGMEAGNQQVLTDIGKGITLDQIREAVYLTKKVGIGVVGSFILGNPGETQETMEETIHFARSLDGDFVHFSIATLYPGSELYERAERESKIRFTSWEDFVGGEYNPTVAYCPDGVSAKDLVQAQRRAYRGFYLRPGYVWGRLGTILHDPRRIEYYLGGLLAYLGVAFGER